MTKTPTPETNQGLDWKSGIDLITKERSEQIEKHGFDTEHDKQHSYMQLVDAAKAYMYRDRYSWPFTDRFKSDGSDEKNFAKAGAFLAAAIDRITGYCPSPERNTLDEAARVDQFETDYQLEQFREIQGSHFDSEGKKYAGVPIGAGSSEMMLKLINQLEAEVLELRSTESVKPVRRLDETEINKIRQILIKSEDLEDAIELIAELFASQPHRH